MQIGLEWLFARAIGREVESLLASPVLLDPEDQRGARRVSFPHTDLGGLKENAGRLGSSHISIRPST